MFRYGAVLNLKRIACDVLLKRTHIDSFDVFYDLIKNYISEFKLNILFFSF